MAAGSKIGYNGSFKTAAHENEWQFFIPFILILQV
jgi:hypothetical protein